LPALLLIWLVEKQKMRGDKFNMVSLHAYKFSAALFCFFGLFLGELGLYLDPIFGPAQNLPSNIVAMLFIVSFFVYGWRAFFLVSLGTTGIHFGLTRINIKEALLLM